MVFHFFNDKDTKEKNSSKDLKSHSSSNLSSSSGSSHSYSSQKYSEWGPEATEVMCNNVRDFAVPGGDGKLTMGDLIDNTSKDFIAKGMLAERVFETWSFGRIVLLGDACHPMDPYGGQGNDRMPLFFYIVSEERRSTHKIQNVSRCRQRDAGCHRFGQLDQCSTLGLAE